MTRPAYLAGAALWTACGRGADAHAQAMAGPACLPARQGFGVLGSKPYFGIAGGSPDWRALTQGVVADLALPPACLQEAALFIGTTAGDMDEHEAQYRAGERPVMSGAGHGGPAAELAAQHGFAGGQHTILTACSSSSNALLMAARMVAQGLVDDAVVIGLEPRNQLSVGGFAALQLIAAETLRPFDAARDGLVLGDAAAAVHVTATPGDCKLLGGASTVDASSPTNSDPQAMADCMLDALTDAGLTVAEVDLLKAHGTATPANDQSEAAALHLCFAAMPPVTGLKGWLGHTLGACGAVEIAALLACLRAGFVPATAGHVAPDEALQITPLTAPVAAAPMRILANFFAFGGNLNSLVLQWKP